MRCFQFNHGRQATKYASRHALPLTEVCSLLETRRISTGCRSMCRSPCAKCSMSNSFVQLRVSCTMQIVAQSRMGLFQCRQAMVHVLSSMI